MYSIFICLGDEPLWKEAEGWLLYAPLKSHIRQLCGLQRVLLISSLSVFALVFLFALLIATEWKNRSSPRLSINMCTVCFLACRHLIVDKLTNSNRTINICFYTYTLIVLVVVFCVLKRDYIPSRREQLLQNLQ